MIARPTVVVEVCDSPATGPMTISDSIIVEDNWSTAVKFVNKVNNRSVQACCHVFRPLYRKTRKAQTGPLDEKPADVKVKLSIVL